MKTWLEFMKEEDAVGVVEVILILVVLVGLVVIFQGQLKSLVDSTFEKINSKAQSLG